MSKLTYFSILDYDGIRGLNVLRDPSDGSLWVANTTIEKALRYDSDISKSKLKSKSLKDFAQYLGVSLEKKQINHVDSLGRPNMIVVVPLHCYEVFSAWSYAHEKNHSIYQCLTEQAKTWAAEYHHYASKFKPSQKSSKEAQIRDHLARQENGRVEEPCLAGRVDVITLLEIIEVKKTAHWKSALGQVLAYNYFFPHLQPRIHLYGACPEQTQDMIIKVCTSQSVRVTWHK